MTEQEALQKHKEDCRRCRDKACKYGIECLQDADIKMYEELLQYRALGTVEELRVARDKQVAKKPIVKGDFGSYKIYRCPCCREELYEDTEWGTVDFEHCTECGQKLDWSDEDESET